MILLLYKKERGNNMKTRINQPEHIVSNDIAVALLTKKLESMDFENAPDVATHIVTRITTADQHPSGETITPYAYMTAESIAAMTPEIAYTLNNKRFDDVDDMLPFTKTEMETQNDIFTVKDEMSFAANIMMKEYRREFAHNVANSFEVPDEWLTDTLGEITKFDSYVNEQVEGYNKQYENRLQSQMEINLDLTGIDKDATQL